VYDGFSRLDFRLIPFPAVVFTDSPCWVIRWRGDDADFVTSLDQPSRHLAGIFADSCQLRRIVQPVDENSQTWPFISGNVPRQLPMINRGEMRRNTQQGQKASVVYQTARQQPLALIGLVLALVFVICGVFAPWLSPHDPTQLDLTGRLLPPSPQHWFGTDELGRDILSRTIYGARISLTVAVSVVGLSLLLGIGAGLTSGFYGGLTDTLLNVYVNNAFLALPGILLAIAFVAFVGPGVLNLVLALALSGWVGYARLIRAQVMAVREREYVEAARGLGASDIRILGMHVLPNIIQPVLVQAAVGMAGAILAEATLSFLGLGIPPPAPSWGSMLNDARSHLFDAPHLTVFPAVAVMLAVLSFNFLGDALRDLLDPRLRATVVGG